MIPYARQEIFQEDIEAVIEVLKSEYLTQGPIVPKFEDTVASHCHGEYAVAMNSATSALHVACLALGVQRGDIVWTSPITFVASANCAIYCGANVDFIDIDSITYNISIEHLSEKLEFAQKSGKLPKVVIPVHLCGQSCDMESINALSKRYGFKIIEDASHAIGGKYMNEPIGNCRYSDITIFSFHPVKIITSGEGGMAVTNNYELAKRMKILRSHGITNDQTDMHPRPVSEIWNYQQIDLGFNYRMTDLHAALGLSQMRRLDEFVNKRHLIAERYDRLLSDLPLQVPRQLPENYSAYHLYVIRLNFEKINITQRDFINFLHSEDIFVNLHYIPVYRQPYYERLGFKSGHCPAAEKYYSEAISIPIYTGLTSEQQDRVIEKIRFAVLFQ
jgi:UDP-4-amino-4,6-dideoxy-N-acetyl-beta-L-altrosamine transaminase